MQDSLYLYQSLDFVPLDDNRESIQIHDPFGFANCNRVDGFDSDVNIFYKSFLLVLLKR